MMWINTHTRTPATFLPLGYRSSIIVSWADDDIDLWSMMDLSKFQDWGLFSGLDDLRYPYFSVFFTKWGQKKGQKRVRKKGKK